MKILIHGDDIEKSRQDFYLEKQKLSNLIFLEGEGLTFDKIFQTFENSSLFDESKTLIVENLFLKIKTNSKEITKILDYINNSKSIDIIIWEQQELSKTNLNLIKNFSIKCFSFPKNLFTFLEQLKPNNSYNLIKLYHELRVLENEDLILFMIIRQFRLLLASQNINNSNIDEINKMAPWQLSRINSQAKYFTKEELLKNYNLLYEIDYSLKTGKTQIPLDTSIDFFLSGL